MRRSGLVVPSDDFAPVKATRVVFHRGPMHMTEHGMEWLHGEIKKGRLKWRNDLPPVAGGSGQLSSFAEQTVLNHITGQDNASWANLAPTFLALCTVTPTSSSTGSTITEASYTGYARASMANTIWTAASGTAPASITNGNTAVTFAACTASTSTIIAMAACSASTVGNVFYWCSCASTVISTTQTPATVAISGLSVSLT